MVETKICAECGVERPITEFNKRRSAKDGLQDRCRYCFSEYNKRRYAADPERHKANVRAYREENLVNVFQTRMRMVEKNPNHKNANEAVNLALKLGYITKQEWCSGCGCTNDERRIEAHHARYDRPLDVIWLCTPCHRRMDAQRRLHEGGEEWPQADRKEAV